jgi:hypothetical protein
MYQSQGGFSMDARKERGQQIAQRCQVVKASKPDEFLVPSQSQGSRKYRVNIKAQTCTCPDHEERGIKCKHVFAAEFTIEREANPDGTITDTETVTLTKRVTYKQDWPAYNAAQSTEKKRMQVLLHDLCRNLPEADRSHTRGPKSHLAKDSVFAMVFKIYCGFSSRRFSTDLEEAFQKGYTTRRIPGIKVAVFLENEAYTPILTELVAKSAAPLSAVETDFAVDSSGFGSSRYERWLDEKWGTPRQKAVWVKAHCSVGVKTNCVAAVRILEKDSGDHPQLDPLVRKTSESFTVNEVSGDKAYTSQENFELVASLGGTGFLMFKANATGGVGGLFEKMFHFFQFQRDEYLQHYHKRSNVESTFSAVKRKFGDAVRSKTDVAMKNEVLCKLIAHNLCCLIQEQEELGIAPIFWKNNN